MSRESGSRFDDMSGAWVEQYRENARIKLKSLSVPSSKDDNYRFFSLKNFSWNQPSIGSRNFLPIPAGLTSLASGECGVVAWRSGASTGENPTIFLNDQLKQLINQGLVVSTLGQILRDPNSRIVEFLKKYWHLHSVFEDDFCAQQVAAHWQNGVVVYVPRAMRVEGVLRGLNWLDESSQAMRSRTLLVVDEDAQCEYVDEYTGSSSQGEPTGVEPSVVLGFANVVAAAGARVRYSQFLHWGESTQFVLRQQFDVHSQAELEYVPIIASRGKGQIRAESFCLGSGASFKTSGAVRGFGQSVLDFWSTTTHGVPRTQSNLDYWTVVQDNAKVIFNGKVVITESGQHTEASQKNKNMLLSPTAEVVSLPKLEIATDDVKCAHGASVASVQEDQLYYLQSRGIPLQQAQEMVIRGFTGPVFAKLPEGELRQRADEALNGRCESW